MKKFTIDVHSGADKSFLIRGPDEFEIEIEIDFDDVYHSQVNKEANAIVKVLNDNLEQLRAILNYE